MRHLVFVQFVLNLVHVLDLPSRLKKSFHTLLHAAILYIFHSYSQWLYSSLMLNTFYSHFFFLCSAVKVLFFPSNYNTFPPLLPVSIYQCNVWP
ncbi:hypothetical protein CW304_26865 [Bacillus sp. UFRGS-B20]|nr:hypothetical protein CW304_26865 [Bacillus sp. UFRGS-B20]